MTNKSNYSVRYEPKKGAGRHRFIVDLNTDFVEFAKSQKLDEKKYADFVHNMIEDFYGKNTADHFRNDENSVYFEGGLLRWVQIPGNASGFSLEKQIDRYYYTTHNLDEPTQSSILLAVLFKYFNELESKI